MTLAKKGVFTEVKTILEDVKWKKGYVRIEILNYPA